MQGWRDERAHWARAPVPAEGTEGACPQRRAPFIRWVRVYSLYKTRLFVFHLAMHPLPPIPGPHLWVWQEQLSFWCSWAVLGLVLSVRPVFELR